MDTVSPDVLPKPVRSEVEISFPLRAAFNPTRPDEAASSLLISLATGAAVALKGSLQEFLLAFVAT